jgi:hypothetical protein
MVTNWPLIIYMAEMQRRAAARPAIVRRPPDAGHTVLALTALK